MSTPPLPPRNPAREKKHTSVVTSHEDLIAALHLVADSVAQQRQPAARTIVYHPVYWTLMLAILSYLHHTFYSTPLDYSTILLIWCGCLTASSTIIKYLVRGYLDAAEKTGRWTWLYGEEPDKKPDRGRKTGHQNDRRPTLDHRRKHRHRDIVLVSWFRGNIIAVVVLRIERVDRRKIDTSPTSSTPAMGISASESGSVSTASSSATTPGQSKRWKAYIRAWTVQQKYRGHGIGREVLSFAVRFCHEKRYGDPVFANDHANSLRVLPWVFDSWMRGVEMRAGNCLQSEILASRGG